MADGVLLVRRVGDRLETITFDDATGGSHIACGMSGGAP